MKKESNIVKVWTTMGLMNDLRTFSHFSDLNRKSLPLLIRGKHLFDFAS